MREGDGRNEACAMRLHHMPEKFMLSVVSGTKDAAVDVALTLNAKCLDPMSIQEVSTVPTQCGR
jgi:hypothetical protein